MLRDHVRGSAGEEGQQPADPRRGRSHPATQGRAVRPLRGHRVRPRPGTVFQPKTLILLADTYA